MNVRGRPYTEERNMPSRDAFDRLRSRKRDDRDRSGKEQTSVSLREGEDAATKYELSIFEAEHYSVSMDSLQTEAQINKKGFPFCWEMGQKMKKKRPSVQGRTPYQTAGSPGFWLKFKTAEHILKSPSPQRRMRTMSTPSI